MKVSYTNLVYLAAIVVPLVCIHIFNRGLTLSYTITGVLLLMLVVGYLEKLEKKIDVLTKEKGNR